MALQTTDCEPVTCDNACPLTNFRAYSPQTADANRRYPSPTGQHAIPIVPLPLAKRSIPM